MTIPTPRTDIERQLFRDAYGQRAIEMPEAPWDLSRELERRMWIRNVFPFIRDQMVHNHNGEAHLGEMPNSPKILITLTYYGGLVASLSLDLSKDKVSRLFVLNKKGTYAEGFKLQFGETVKRINAHLRERMNWTTNSNDRN